jgi:hypothetical protein
VREGEREGEGEREEREKRVCVCVYVMFIHNERTNQTFTLLSPPSSFLFLPLSTSIMPPQVVGS